MLQNNVYLKNVLLSLIAFVQKQMARENIFTKFHFTNALGSSFPI